MNSTTTRHFRVGLTLAIAVTFSSTCWGDLFALLTGDGGIVRMDSTTGAVIDTYSMLEPPSATPILSNAGLAFDGRRLYVSRRFNTNTEEVWSFELATETWAPVGILDTVSIGSNGPHQLSGLGYTPGLFGEGSLLSVTRRVPNTRPSYLVENPLGPPFDYMLQLAPVVEFPADIDTHGVDFEPATGEIWIAAEEVDGMTRTPILLQSDRSGNILASVSPAIALPVIPRGLAFDSGDLFVAVRNLPSIADEVYEIDRNTGAVLNTFLIPGSGTVAALTGGTVVPEPATVVLCAMSVLPGVSRRRAVR